MSTSGIYTLSKNLNEIASEAFDILQIGADGETLNGDMVSRAKTSLNLMLKEWQSQGIHLWSYTEGSLFLAVGQEKYDFRDASTHVANDWFETTTTAATIAGANTILVTSADNIQDGDPIGVIQNDNNLFWTTVNGAPSGLTVTLTDNITLPTLSGAFVRNYRVGTATAPELIPVSRVLNVRRQESTDYEIPIVFESRQDYFDLPNKSQVGTPIQAYYSRQDLAGETSGIMYLWNSPISSVPVINFTYERKIQIMVNEDDTLDVPDYAQMAVIYNLADMLIPKYGASQGLAVWVKTEAQRLKNDMLAYDAAVYPIKMKMRRYG
jgi:hypothetical protein